MLEYRITETSIPELWREGEAKPDVAVPDGREVPVENEDAEVVRIEVAPRTTPQHANVCSVQVIAPTFIL
jgi:hypothetical protein